MMKRTLFTIGYGNMLPEKFVAKLKENGITMVADVRRLASKSWNSRYRAGSIGMGTLLYEADIEYSHWHEFGNECGIDKYLAWLREPKPDEVLQELTFFIEDSIPSVWCLICCEKDVYKDGKVNCHRKYGADAMVKLLGDDWRVEHL